MNCSNNCGDFAVDIYFNIVGNDIHYFVNRLFKRRKIFLCLLTRYFRGGESIFDSFFLFGAFCVVRFQFSPVLEVCFKNFVICILGNLLVLYLNGLNTK